MIERNQLRDSIKLCQLELREREVGIDNPTDELTAWSESIAELSDSSLVEIIDFCRDRILDVMAHRGLALASEHRQAIVRWMGNAA